MQTKTITLVSVGGSGAVFTYPTDKYTLLTLAAGADGTTPTDKYTLVIRALITVGIMATDRNSAVTLTAVMAMHIP